MSNVRNTQGRFVKIYNEEERRILHNLSNKRWRNNNREYTKKLYYRDINKSRRKGRDKYHNNIEKSRAKSKEQYYKHRKRNLEYCKNRRHIKEYKNWHREYKRKWEAENKDKKSSYYEKWYKIKGKTYHRDWRKKQGVTYELNKKAYTKEWWKNNPCYKRDWYLKNRLRELARGKKWREENSDKYKLMVKAYNHNRRKCGKVTAKILQEIYEENIKNFGTLTCVLCNQPILFGEDSIEHKLPLSRGGTHDKNNLAVAHLKCNKMKQANTLDEWYARVEKEKSLCQIQTL